MEGGDFIPDEGFPKKSGVSAQQSNQQNVREFVTKGSIMGRAIPFDAKVYAEKKEKARQYFQYAISELDFKNIAEAKNQVMKAIQVMDEIEPMT